MNESVEKEESASPGEGETAEIKRPEAARNSWPISLRARFMIWLGLYLLLLAVVSIAWFRQIAPKDSLIPSMTASRLEPVALEIFRELRLAPFEQWDATVDRFSEAHPVEFFVFHDDGSQLAGAAVELPEKLMNDRVSRSVDNPEAGAVIASQMSFAYARTDEPRHYWAAFHSPGGNTMNEASLPVSLIVRSDSVTGHGMFIDYKPWLAMGAGLVALSLLWWFPIAARFNQTVRKITHATERIAEGQFAARVDVERGDELGRLSRAVNRMASRLGKFVTGQKRFLGDIAHELCAPLSRLQIALGILEAKEEGEPSKHLKALRRDLDHMSSLVSELLSLSRAGIKPQAVKLKQVNLSRLLPRIIAREERPDITIELDAGENIIALGEPDLISRAVANLLRNARRYAGAAGPVSVSAEYRDETAMIVVRDQGPGVPPEIIEDIFDPFFREDESRSPGSSGAGLGLAITKACVDSCKAKIHARNCEPTGLEVSLIFRKIQQSRPA